jgi:hypothetical protein
MGKIVLNRIVTREEIMDILKKNLGPAFQIEIKKNSIQIVQDASKGCLVLNQEKDNKTTVELSGFMPSGGLRAAIIIGLLVLLFIIGWQIGYLIIGVGVIPFLLMFLLMKVPSRPLVIRIDEILRNI